MIKTKSFMREALPILKKALGWDKIPKSYERRMKLEELCVEKGIDFDILQKLSGIASLYGYSEEFCNFLASFSIPFLGCFIDDNSTDYDVFIESLMSRDPEERVLKIIFGYVLDRSAIDGPCFVSEEYMDKYEKEQEEKFNNPRAYYAKYGEKEYNWYCDKDGIFSYAAFLKQNHR